MDRIALNDYISKHLANIRAIEATRYGKAFFSGRWHGFAPTDAVNVMSVTKSVVALLIGIAIDKGLIKGAEQRVLDFFPDYKIKRGEKTIQSVTLKHLLTMTAPYKYVYEPWTKVCTQGDWTIAALDLLGGRAGITGEFKYSTLGIHILMGVIARVCGMPTIDFANRYLFKPLGIAEHANFTAETAEEHKQFTLSKLPRENVWFSDPAGVNTAGWGLCLTASDMAKLGQMCLDGGARIISAEWINECTRPRVKPGERFSNMSYGYLWWIPDERAPAYAAIGNGGNVIYVNPLNGVVVAVAATFDPRVYDRVEFIQKYIEPLAAV